MVPACQRERAAPFQSRPFTKVSPFGALCGSQAYTVGHRVERLATRLDASACDGQASRGMPSAMKPRRASSSLSSAWRPRRAHGRSERALAGATSRQDHGGHREPGRVAREGAHRHDARARDDAHPDAVHLLEGRGGRARHHDPGADPCTIATARGVAQADPVDGRRLRRPERPRCSSRRTSSSISAATGVTSRRAKYQSACRADGTWAARRSSSSRATTAGLPRRDGLHGSEGREEGTEDPERRHGVDAGAKVASNDDSSGGASGPRAASSRGQRRLDGPGERVRQDVGGRSRARAPSGCGCVTAGLEGDTFAGGAAALLGLAFVVARRRR